MKILGVKRTRLPTLDLKPIRIPYSVDTSPYVKLSTFIRATVVSMEIRFQDDLLTLVSFPRV